MRATPLLPAVLAAVLVGAPSHMDAQAADSSGVDGCYEVYRVASNRAELYPGIFRRGPDRIRLDTAAGAVQGTRHMAPLGVVPASARMDTSFMRSYWQITASGALKLVRSDGFVGRTVVLQRTDSVWRGRSDFFGDDARVPPGADMNVEVVARRIRCPGERHSEAKPHPASG